MAGRAGRANRRRPAPTVRAAPPPPPLAAENTWNLDLSTGGRVVIQLRPDVAPNDGRADQDAHPPGHFYDGLAFYRVIEGFMAQGGDPAE